MKISYTPLFRAPISHYLFSVVITLRHHILLHNIHIQIKYRIFKEMSLLGWIKLLSLYLYCTVLKLPFS